MVEKEILEEYINHMFPLGPMDAPSIDNGKEIQRILFDENNDLYKSLSQGISLIIGRKGSCKTSLLNSASFERDSDKTIIVSLDSDESADIFTRIVEEIDALSAETALVEQVSNLWEVVIWGVVFRQLYDLYGDEMIGRYIDGFDIKDFNGSPYQLIDRQINVIKQFPPAARPVPQKVRYTKVNDLTFLEVKEQALRIIRAKKQMVFILMDSLENYMLHKHENSAALGGLLRCVSSIAAEKVHFILRCCVPAEKYHNLLKFSQNPIKDF